tara:strand:- start:233 stop:541 length:309 start_codon:yes stop_codon:yes gene_type:complete
MKTSKESLISLANSLNATIKDAKSANLEKHVGVLDTVLDDVLVRLYDALAPEKKPKKKMRTSIADLDMADVRGVQGRSWSGSNFWNDWAENFSENKEKSIAP